MHSSMYYHAHILSTDTIFFNTKGYNWKLKCINLIWYLHSKLGFNWGKVVTLHWLVLITAEFNLSC